MILLCRSEEAERAEREAAYEAGKEDEKARLAALAKRTRDRMLKQQAREAEERRMKEEQYAQVRLPLDCSSLFQLEF